MNITRFTDYALRVLVYLNVDTEHPARIQDVAESYDISKNHLMKVVQVLNAQGYVKATRGRNGGIALSRPASEINIGELVRYFEEGSKLVECFGADNQCVITPACQIKQMFTGAMEQFFCHLDQFTLADMTVPSQQKLLAELLHLPTDAAESTRAQ
ncbi:RrF2 family transcriptional regulator [Reinekea blandensis]|uniref:Rrf2 family transcriptional regulator n=1 Tax=Reinekea blandensis MED297 TaxID=314283 RepID=A4BIJ7_9GAMM|nr:Rrf2 family transcriptional regulator [Reinekea blandensis]EAR08076.1 hypothetical protein MED297_07531 [Reinekea sp. MED297] [Reinekea blandensis MED297]